jgi:hypothetical protein
VTELVHNPKSRVLEGEVLPPGPTANYYSVNGSWNPTNLRDTFRNYHPSPVMRKMGYTANPDTCRHHRKGYAPRDGWWCRDCGDKLDGK